MAWGVPLGVPGHPTRHVTDMTRPISSVPSSGSSAPDRGSAAQFEALDKGLEYRLTLVLRPSGFDEASLLRRWLHTTPWPVTMLALTPADNEPHTFLVNLARSVSARAGDSVVRAGDPDLTLEDGIIDLLNAAVHVPGHFIWILKDYDLITDAAIHHAVSWMLDYIPPHMHLYLTLDQEPPLPGLPRLRARRHLLTLSMV
jgi:LuxR family transcriptional regulator, maltose regulon positive regulatory protein